MALLLVFLCGVIVGFGAALFIVGFGLATYEGRRAERSEP
jgi:hypothetical protein